MEGKVTTLVQVVDKGITKEDKGGKDITQEICVVIQSAVLSAKGTTNVSKLGLSVSPVHAVLHMLALVR